METNTNCVNAHTRIRISMEQENGGKFEFVFPRNPDNIDGYALRTLEYTDELGQPEEPQEVIVID